MAHVLITGASSGFGYEIACRAARRGHRVFATMRDSTGRNRAARASLEAMVERERVGIEVLDLDVTDEGSVSSAVDQALARVGHLDAVVNNAGIASIGVTEAFTPEQYLHVFDVNVAGAVRVNRAVLPSMRRRRSGLLVHVSSAAGRATVPGLAPYCASKYALEALADAYRYELHQWGVQSILVEPGIYRTPIFDDAVTPADRDRLDTYGSAGAYVDQVGHVFTTVMASVDNPGADPVADVIVQLVEMEPSHRPFRTVVSPPLEQLLKPYNDMAESHRGIVAATFGVEALVHHDTTVGS